MIVDVFSYNTLHPSLLQLRYHTLKDHVDEFLIFSTLEFECNFGKVINRNLFEDTIADIIADYPDDTVFIVSDLGEIINPTHIGWVSSNITSPDMVIKIPLIYLNNYANARVYNKISGVPESYDMSLFICVKQPLVTLSPGTIRSPDFYIYQMTNSGHVIPELGWAFTFNESLDNPAIPEVNKADLPKNIEDFIPCAPTGTISFPMIGTAIVNDTYWVTRLISSVDFPVDTFVIVNNGGSDELAKDLEQLRNLNKRFIKQIKVINLPGNIGVAGWWNLAIKCFLDLPYWILVNDDVAFTPGLLKELFVKSCDEKVGIIHGTNEYMHTGSWDLFLMRDFVIEKYGLFDENIYPAYWEDAEYIMRMIADGDTIPRIWRLDHKYYHGETTSYAKSASKSTEHMKAEMMEVNLQNRKYVEAKWGEGLHNRIPYRHPYNNPDLHPSHSIYDLKANRKKILRKINDR
jgi:GT2 family glycosyltransferase